MPGVWGAQAEHQYYPVLALLGLHPAAASASAAQFSGCLALAQSLDRWQGLQALLKSLAALCCNLLEQLGALCAAQTRKATILRGGAGQISTPAPKCLSMLHRAALSVHQPCDAVNTGGVQMTRLGAELQIATNALSCSGLCRYSTSQQPES